MMVAARQLIEDFLSTIIFLPAFALSGSIPVAVGITMAATLTQFAVLRLRGRALDPSSASRFGRGLSAPA